VKKLQLKTGQIAQIVWMNGNKDIGIVGTGDAPDGHTFLSVRCKMGNIPFYSLLNNAESVTLTDCYSISDYDNATLLVKDPAIGDVSMSLTEEQLARVNWVRGGKHLDAAIAITTPFDLFWTGYDHITHYQIGDTIKFHGLNSLRTGKIVGFFVEDRFVGLKVNDGKNVWELFGIDTYNYNQGSIYVRMNKHYTATVMSPLALTDYIKSNEGEIDWANIAITKVNRDETGRFETAIKYALIANRQQHIPFNVGDDVEVYANQGVRDGQIIAIQGEHLLLSYEMPNGSVSCRQYTIADFSAHDAYGRKHDCYNYDLPDDKYKTVSRKQAMSSKRWGHIQWTDPVRNSYGRITEQAYPIADTSQRWIPIQLWADESKAAA